MRAAKDEVGVHEVSNGADHPPKVVLPGSHPPVNLGHKSVGARPGRSNEEARRTQRARIIDAFVREVGRSGFENAHVSTVCSTASVSTKDFYKHFASKKHCFCESLDEGAAIVFDASTAAYRAASGPWPDRLRLALRTMLEILAENPAFARLCIVEPFNVVPMGRAHIDAVVARCRDEFGGGIIPSPPGVKSHDYERFLVASIIGPMSDYVIDGKTDRLPELEPLITYALMLPLDNDWGSSPAADGEAETPDEGTEPGAAEQGSAE